MSESGDKFCNQFKAQVTFLIYFLSLMKYLRCIGDKTTCPKKISTKLVTNHISITYTFISYLLLARHNQQENTYNRKAIF